MFSGCKNEKAVDRVKQENGWHNKSLNKLNELLLADSITEFHLAKSVPGFIKKFIQEITDEKLELADSLNFFWDDTDAKIDGHVDTTISGSGKKMVRAILKSGKVYKDSGGIQLSMPDKELIVFGMGNKTAFISFIQGGFVGQPKFYIFSYSGETIDEYWYGEPVNALRNKEQANFFMGNIINELD